MIGINQIFFGDKGTYSDYGLLMTGRTIGTPTLKKQQLDIPFRDGLLDYTQSNGRTYYGNRTLEFSFKLIDPDRFYRVHSDISNYLHGQYMKVSILEDPSYYFYGMCSVADLEVSKALGQIQITVDAEPYRYSKAEPNADIRWDDVNFETTYFRYIGTLTISDSYQLIIQKGGIAVVPTITVTSISSETLTVRSSRNSRTYTLVTGRNRFPDMTVCGNTDVTLTFTGSGVLRVDYKESIL